MFGYRIIMETYFWACLWGQIQKSEPVSAPRPMSVGQHQSVTQDPRLNKERPEHHIRLSVSWFWSSLILLPPCLPYRDRLYPFELWAEINPHPLSCFLSGTLFATTAKFLAQQCLRSLPEVRQDASSYPLNVIREPDRCPSMSTLFHLVPLLKAYKLDPHALLPKTRHSHPAYTLWAQKMEWLAQKGSQAKPVSCSMPYWLPRTMGERRHNGHTSWGHQFSSSGRDHLT